MRRWTVAGRQHNSGQRQRGGARSRRFAFEAETSNINRSERAFSQFPTREDCVQIAIHDNNNAVDIIPTQASARTTSPSYKLDVSGDINASGSARANEVPLTSDGTLKDAPTPTKAALSKLAAVRGYEFTWSDKARQMGLPEGTQHGLIAQEVEQIFPDLVSEWEVETGEYVEGENGEQTPMKERIKCVDYARMVPILLEAVRELAGRVDALSRSSRSPQSAQSP